MTTATATASHAAEIIEKLRRFDTPTICNVIELFGTRSQTEGYMDGRIRAAFPKMQPSVGYAVTMTFRSAAPPKGSNVYGSLAKQMEAIVASVQPSVVVIQDLDDPPRAAVFGEVMCTAYKAFGAKGLITNGAGRDLLQVEAIDFPVFTGETICSHGYPQMIDINVPVSVGGLMVYPGDLIHADANGVTNIPPQIVERVAELTPGLMDAESVMMDYLREPNATPDGFAEMAGKAGEMMKELKRRAVKG